MSKEKEKADEGEGVWVHHSGHDLSVVRWSPARGFVLIVELKISLSLSLYHSPLPLFKKKKKKEMKELAKGKE